MNRNFLIAVCFLGASCVASFAQNKAEAEKLAAALKGDNAGVAAVQPSTERFAISR